MVDLLWLDDKWESATWGEESFCIWMIHDALNGENELDLRDRGFVLCSWIDLRGTAIGFNIHVITLCL